MALPVMRPHDPSITESCWVVGGMVASSRFLAPTGQEDAPRTSERLIWHLWGPGRARVLARPVPPPDGPTMATVLQGGRVRVKSCRTR